MTQLTPAPDDSVHAYRIEIWSAPPEAAGELIETINRSTNFAVSTAARHEALLQCPGKYIVHMNGRHRMSCDLAPDPTNKHSSQDQPEASIQQPYAPGSGIKLSQLAQWYFLAGVCKQCQHVGSIDRWEIGRKYGNDVILQMLYPKLRCTICDNKLGNRMTLGKMPR